MSLYALVRALTLCTVTILLLAPALRAQEARLSTDPDRELIVMFQPGAVVPPVGRSSGAPDAFQVVSTNLRQALRENHVETVAALIPGFAPEDRFAVSKTGETVELTDWSRVFLIRVAQPERRSALLDALQDLPDVVYAEPNGRVGLAHVVDFAPLAERLSTPFHIALPLLPDDPGFFRQFAWQNTGASQQGGGTPGADVRAVDAWDITTGSANVHIGIVDSGIDAAHPDFSGRVTGDAGFSASHGTLVAGIAAATGNNAVGGAGMAWAGAIISERFETTDTDATLAASVRSASSRGASVLNNSWSLLPAGRASLTIRLAFKDVYLLDRVAVASMGNSSAQTVYFPAAITQGVISVGATTNQDGRASYSTTGSWIDVSAPGGGGLAFETPEDLWYTPIPGGAYAYSSSSGLHKGTSLSAPVVTGLAALLLAVNPALENDDIEQIIRLGADDRGAPGFDNEFGAGRVNARRSLDLARAPYTFSRAVAQGGTSQGAGSNQTMNIYGAAGLPDGAYVVRRHEVRRTVFFPHMPGVNVWGRHSGAVGWSLESPNVAVPYTAVVPGTVTSTSAVLRTYVYEVRNSASGSLIGWWPSTPQNARFAYTVHGIPQPFAVAISGPTSIVRRQYATWTNASSGGLAPYTQQWSTFFPCPPPPPCTGTVCTESLPNQPQSAPTIESDPQCGLWHTVETAASYTTRVFTAPSFQLRLVSADAAGTTDQVTWTVTTAATAQDGGSAGVRTAPHEASALAGSGFETRLGDVYPNPSRGAALVRYTLAAPAVVRVAVYDALGREVAHITDDAAEAGYHEPPLDLSRLPGGVYVVRMQAGAYTSSRTLTLIR